MRSEKTKAARSSKQIAQIRVQSRIIPPTEPDLTPLIAEEPSDNREAERQFLNDALCVFVRGTAASLADWGVQ